MSLFFARYAGDSVVHGRNQKQAEAVMQIIAALLKERALTRQTQAALSLN